MTTGTGCNPLRLHTTPTRGLARRRAGLAALLILLPAGAPLLAAQNRLFNPDLDDNTIGWADNSPSGFPAWDPQDRNSCVDSGSAFLTGVGGPPLFLASLSQCAPIAGEATLVLKIETQTIFALGPVEGFVQVDLHAGGCDTPPIDTDGSPPFSVPLSTWTTMQISIPVPPGASSARAIYQLASPAAFDALFDAAFVGEEEFEIFRDGFERGSVCRWGGS